ncbi:Asp23/Gls24 family envelope stress response protein [Acetanaerobacterium elongatum]|uniref:Uncharacterized conserved protein YloU, alkaline shock protein (Asp23) family n=1 Tax=Acetanaerobacterium elongatum TaxID=258515 RepID=A0A1H0GPJ3_9FIRM|nr:Asp23/Gls24 family envelope stress response protein [Acetanaerobacterium elongatum]SDO08719.1 Uncharacterized conserved protein YloU, alkaline shock protein (Asp23) family [Acetanaerobacterium elongatum]
MIRIENPMGYIEISGDYFANLVGSAASSCFGVAGMATSGTVQGLRSLIISPNLPDKGVHVRNRDGKLEIDLHIAVTYGVNIAAIVKSIINKVSYTVQETTGLIVNRVNVFVDEMKAD